MRRRTLLLAPVAWPVAAQLSCPPGQRAAEVTGETQTSAIEFSLTLPGRIGGGVKLKLPWVTSNNKWKCEPVPPPAPPTPAPPPNPPRIAGHQITAWGDWLLVASGYNVLGGTLRLLGPDGSTATGALDCRGIYALAPAPETLNGFPYTSIVIDELVVESWGAPFTATQEFIGRGVFSTLWATPEQFSQSVGVRDER